MRRERSNEPSLEMETRPKTRSSIWSARCLSSKSPIKNCRMRTMRSPSRSRMPPGSPPLPNDLQRAGSSSPWRIPTELFVKIIDSFSIDSSSIDPLFAMKYFVASIFVLLSANAFAQLSPSELTPDSYVKLVLQDSSEFYVNVLGRPVPDRIIVETSYGRLEIPLASIATVIDYRYNWVQKDDLKQAALKNAADAQHYAVAKFLSQPKLPFLSTVATKDHDIFIGHRYLFDDTAHVILSTPYGDLFFKYPDLDYVDNWSGQNDRREDFSTARYTNAKDPLSSQDFLLPTARSFGSGNLFVMDYMIAGLQLNYGVSDWLSVNAGGLVAPFLPTSVSTATAGVKITPLSEDLFTVSAGFQGVYSSVVKVNQI